MKYRDRAEVRDVILDLGLFPAWEAGKLLPASMPDKELRDLALMIEEAFAFGLAFVNLFRAELGLTPETFHIRF